MEFPTALPTLKSGDITLSPLTLTDSETVFHLVVKNRMYLRTWLNWVDETNSVEHTSRFVQKALQQHQDHTGLYYVIWIENLMVGLISFNTIDDHDKKAVVGYWIDEEHQGKGHTTTALKLLVGFGFETLSLHRIEAHVAKENNASSAVPLKLGFQKEAVLREAEWLNDHFTDLELYSILASEWSS